MTDREFLERMDRRQERVDEHMARGNELMEQIREEQRLNRDEHRRNRAAFNQHQKVMAELVLDVRENTAVLRDLRSEVRAQSEGTLRILDALRGDEPPGAPA